MSEIRQILCIKWGTFYGPEYVNRMYGMVRRNLREPFKLICFTERTEGIRSEVECLPLPELGCEHPQRTHGKWRKVALWGRDLHGLKGVALFLDLDSVIVGDIGPYFTHGHPDDVILARNWARPLKRLGQTSVFRFPIGRNGHILDNFRADPQGVADRFRYEQHYMTHSVTGGIKFWPESWTRHFRLHCLAPLPFRYFRVATLPRDVRIVTFPGGPNPGDVVDGRWDPECPPYVGPWAHFMAGFDPDRRVHPKWFQHVRRFVRPVPWIRQHWVE